MEVPGSALHFKLKALAFKNFSRIIDACTTNRDEALLHQARANAPRAKTLGKQYLLKLHFCHTADCLSNPRGSQPRQGHREHRSLVGAFAEARHRAVVQLNQAFHERQANTQAALRAVARALALRK